MAVALRPVMKWQGKQVRVAAWQSGRGKSVHVVASPVVVRQSRHVLSVFGKLRLVTVGRGSCVTVRLVDVRCVTACYGDARIGLAMFGSQGEFGRCKSGLGTGGKTRSGSHGIASPGEVSRVDVGSVVAR